MLHYIGVPLVVFLCVASLFDLLVRCLCCCIRVGVPLVVFVLFGLLVRCLCCCISVGVPLVVFLCVVVSLTGPLVVLVLQLL